MAYVLGIDVSTTATKAVLVDEAGAVAGRRRRPSTAFDQPHPLWSEQDPRAVVGRGRVAAIRDGAGRDRASTRRTSTAVGLTGQMHGAVLLDAAERGPAAGDPVERPAHGRRVRRDPRGASAPERLIEITGNDALTGFTAPEARLGPRPRARRLGAASPTSCCPRTTSGCGSPASTRIDKADGAGTILFDLAARDWSPEVLDALGIDPAWLPPTFEGPEVTGTITADAAAATGLRAGTPVVAGGGDQAANAVGVGAVVPGTRRAVARDVGRRVRDDGRGRSSSPRGRVHAFCHAVPGKLAPDVGDALGRRQPALVPRRARARRCRSARSSTGATVRLRARAATACCSCPTSPASAARTPTRWPAARSSG